jgi:hypothetical protein
MVRNASGGLKNADFLKTRHHEERSDVVISFSIVIINNEIATGRQVGLRDDHLQIDTFSTYPSGG